MPKNSRRKKSARQRAARRGENYTRALRAVGETRSWPEHVATASPDAAHDEASWAQDLLQIRRVQEVVEARGWVVSRYAHEEFDDDGRAATMDVCWDYPAASSATAATLAHRLPGGLEDDYPRAPECSVGWDERLGLVVKVQTAGNWGGCRRHRTDLHIVPIAEAEAATHHRLRRLLATVERAARAVDPELLIDCTSRGPCGRRAHERAARRNSINVWTGKMVEVARRFSAEEMAELQAWDDEHLGGRVLKSDGEPFGTSDWPGWVPLIGPAPWDERPTPDGSETDAPDPGPIPVPSPDNDGVPIDLLRPVLNGRGVSAGACGLWGMLVSYYWSCEDDRTVTQLHEHQPDDITETDTLLSELVAAGMITISASGMVTINPDELGVISPPQP